MTPARNGAPSRVASGRSPTFAAASTRGHRPPGSSASPGTCRTPWPASCAVSSSGTAAPLPLADYVPLRGDASAVLTCFDVIEICTHAELPDQVNHSAVLQEIILI